MSQGAQTETVLRVQSPKGLSDETAKELTQRMQRAAAVLSKAVQPAVEAWVWAIQHGFKGYRPTLKAAGVEPTGHMQRCYEIARAMVETETSLADITEQAETDRIEDIAKAARDLLKSQGLVAAKGKVRTAAETASKVVDTIVRIIENLEKPVGERSKSNPGLPKPADVPGFNVRAAVIAALTGQTVNLTLTADVAPQAVAVAGQAG